MGKCGRNTAQPNSACYIRKTIWYVILMTPMLMLMLMVTVDDMTLWLLVPDTLPRL